jgi:DNA-binding response OmpR family regulator
LRPRILLVEDEPSIARAVAYGLDREGFDVEVAGAGEEGLERALEEPFDVLVLDLMLPGISGLDVCRTIRQRSDLPILMLTARTSEMDQVLGLEIGADDYVTKPFSIATLTSRVRAILRRRELDRAAATATAIRRVGEVEIDLSRHHVLVSGQAVRVTPAEFRLLALLADQPERAFSRREIMQHLWASNHVGDPHACDVHVSKLRQKIERDPASPKRLLTVRGVGYKLVSA